MFLRLRHIDLGKVYSSYTAEISKKDEYFNLSFDMNDPVIKY